MFRKTMSVLTGAAALSLSAMSAGHAESYKLNYDRAELETDSGAAEVYDRITKLAADVCESRYGASSMVKRYSSVRKRCEADVVDKLVKDVDDPRLAYIHAEETNKKS